jgi:hypothetical protein
MNDGVTNTGSLRTCPSAPQPGSVLLGVVVGNGQVAYLNPSPPVTRDFCSN